MDLRQAFAAALWRFATGVPQSTKEDEYRIAIAATRLSSGCPVIGH
jgi:hypothetical protein